MALRERSPIAAGVALATAAAIAFGITTPLVAQASAGLGPFTVSALLYAGAALLSFAAYPFVDCSGRRLARADSPRLALVALCGAVAAPVLYVAGLGRAGPTITSLVLNFEAVFTALFAWLLYREPIGPRVLVAMLLMLAGGVLMVEGRSEGAAPLLGVVSVVAATASWAADNGLSRRLAEVDPTDVVLAKCGLGAAATGALAFLTGEPAPASVASVALLTLGATGYGLSLRLYLLAQRRSGASARRAPGRSSRPAPSRAPRSPGCSAIAGERPRGSPRRPSSPASCSTRPSGTHISTSTGRPSTTTPIATAKATTTTITRGRPRGALPPSPPPLRRARP